MRAFSRSLSVAALLLLLVAPALAPAATASHPLPASGRALLQEWFAEADAAVRAPARGSDRTDYLRVRAEAEATVAAGTTGAAAVLISRFHAFADFLNASANAPVDDGTVQSRESHRLHFMNASAAHHALALGDLAAVKAALKATKPLSGGGFEYAVIAARIVVGAEDTLRREYFLTFGELRNSTNPDTSAPIYRERIASAISQSAGVRILLRHAEDVLRLSAAEDAVRASVLTTDGLDRLYSAHRVLSDRSNPLDAADVKRARDAWRAEEPLYAVAATFILQELRWIHGQNFRVDSAGPDVSDARLAAREAFTRAEAALNETARYGLPGAVLRESTATGAQILGRASGAQSLLAAAGTMSTAHSFHRTLIDAVTPSPVGGGISPLAIGVIGAVAVLGALLFFARRRGT